jgi:hypothetical protein
MQEWTEAVSIVPEFKDLSIRVYKGEHEKYQDVQKNAESLQDERPGGRIAPLSRR